MPTIDKEHFINFIRDRPPIWDINRRKGRTRAINEAASLFGLTAKEVKKQYRNLRTYYVKEKNKVGESIQTGVAYTPAWRYFKLLTFLDDASKKTEMEEPDSDDSESTVLSSPTQPSAPCPPAPKITPANPTPIIPNTKRLRTIVPKVSTPTFIATLPKPIESPPPVNEMKRPLETATHSMPEEDADQPPKLLITSKSVGNDLLDHFGATISSQIRGLPSRQLRSYAMLKIHQLLYEIQYGTSHSTSMANISDPVLSCDQL